MGETLWAAVTTEEVIPARIVHHVDIDAGSPPTLRSALDVGGKKSPRFATRNL